ncbi:T9SS type A sorting domain-containing protein [Hymenobacter lucidus]|uniref:T9SS type A sorting domain-containing protein n=1 Tax=Hymenobacter lucidus TaxID=2880930 RepID=A0ABS8ANE0_9BACT|nr:T9SS type A sorting domain-containing protein [Hymenobacter lucidus]MCB2407725.1 T9SS type A sorting domain-containing protein [Hymenobacter lucidus]
MKSIYKGTLLFLGWLFCALFPIFQAQAQREANNWYFGNQAGVSFATGSPVAVTNGAMTSYEGSASISNAAGQLLLYSNSEQVWDANHQVMPNGSNLGGQNSATQGALILRAPGSTSLYYVFTVDAIDNNLVGGLRYSIIDMTLRGGLGDVTATKSVRLPTPTLAGKVTEKLTAALHSNGSDYWIVVHGWQSNSFYSFLLSSSGISTTPVVSAVGPVHQGGGSFFGAANAVGYMRISPNGSKLALALRDSQFELYDFNKATGSVSNYIGLLGTSTFYYGVEFSPDNSRLYTSMYADGATSSTIYQYNLLAGSGAAIQNSRQTVGFVNGLAAALQNGPDGKIYVSALNKAYLSSIAQPNALGSACNFREGTVALGAKLSQNGLPNFPNAFAFVANEWTGAVSTTYTDAANWSAGYVPGATDDVVIKATAIRMPVLTASTSASAHTFTVASGASMTVDGTFFLGGDLINQGTFNGDGELQIVEAGAHSIGGSLLSIRNLTLTNGAVTTLTGPAQLSGVLALSENLTTNGNTLTLLSNAAGTAMVVNYGPWAVNGAVTVQRYIAPGLNGGLGYRHYSAPVSNTTLADLTTAGFSPVFNTDYNTAAEPGTVTPFPTVFGYSQQRLATASAANGGFNAGWFSPGAATEAMTPGVGYTVNLDAANLVDFVGTLNNGSITRGGLTRTADAEGGWHLLGNPYPAPIDWNLAFGGAANLLNSVYVFKSSGQYDGSYASYVNGVGSARYIAAGQGFFVRAPLVGATGSLTFSNSARLTSYLNPDFNRATTTETRPLVQLDLVGGQRHDAAYVYFERGATGDFDAAFDAYKITTGEVAALAVHNGAEPLSISGLPNTLASGATVTVPLSVYTPQAGTYTLEAAQLLNLPTGTVAYLRDAQTGTLVNLERQPSYAFSSGAGLYSTTRFALVFGPAQVLSSATARLSEQLTLFPNPAQAQVTLTLPEVMRQQAVTIAVVNTLGQTVLRHTLTTARNSSAPVVLPLSGLAKGVYMVQLSSAAGTAAKKLVIN